MGNKSLNRIMLVARRDFRQIVATRGFRLTLLILPAMIGIVILVTSFLRPSATSAYVMADAGGGFARLVEHRLEVDYQRQVLRDLSAYAARWHQAPPGDGWADDTAVESFIARGGADAALQQMHLPSGAPAFKPPAPAYVRVAAPAGVPTNRGPAAFGRAMAPYLTGDIQTPEGKRPLAVAAYVSAGAPARIWTSGRNANALIDTIQEERTRQLRLSLLAANGVAPAAATRIEGLEAPLAVTAPPAGGGRAQMTVRSIVPLVLVYLLLMSAFITGSMMLQGVIEERSNRLLEAVLACVEPREVMYGKLIGLGAVGLTILVSWIGCALLAAFAIQGAVADYVRPSLAALNQPWMIPLMIFYFLCGYMILAMAFLAIGSLSDSMQDAQGYLMPVTMGILIPVMLLVQTSVTNPSSPLPGILSWIPVYTPFAMLARLGTGVQPWEIAGTGLLLLVFVVLELTLLGRVFRASLLASGQQPGLGGFVKLMLRRD